ncbi:sugar ABC transporter permease [bacterium]|nr:sugar ABC transporter permease [bacterium]MBU1427986.1 sugar ABC transporter permease [bacterium]MBU4562974.1 sugar ABC transporter permease [bacterium]
MGNGWSSLKEKTAPYVLLSPFLFGFVIFFSYAFIRSLYFSFTDYDLFSIPNWVGITNYINLFKEHLFNRALRNSLTFAIIVTTLQTIFALLLAVVMNQKIRGIKYFRTAYYMPSVTSSIVITLIFMWMFQRKGVINYLLTLLHQYGLTIGIFLTLLVGIQLLLVVTEKLRGRPVEYLEPSYIVISIILASIITYVLKDFGIIKPVEAKAVDIFWLSTREKVPFWAGPFAFPRPLGAIMILNIWTTTPTFMILYLAGLQDIPQALYEAAEVDGAKGWQKFWYITVPQLKHITFLIVVLGLIGTLQMFDQVKIIGGQSPLESTITLAYYVYQSAFPGASAPKIGMASAAAIILAVLTLTIVFIQKMFSGEGRGLRD